MGFWQFFWTTSIIVYWTMTWYEVCEMCAKHSQCGEVCDDDDHSTQSTEGSSIPLIFKMKCYIFSVLIALLLESIETEAQQSQTISATFTQKGFYTDYGCTNLAYVSD